ncbi:hypothetical protein KP79_PYT23205 [Mizuhopecten yessoensis]|uniref:Chitin-binding type-4 domain-containing protein n=1 Tax=Mizuhopecten yessoensis TaxID=6573 RepID=A0A210QMK9_MIZYE|nr:hypothetical protein KP79_PYT23205 [Mizuhopecten yessoensis]
MSRLVVLLWIHYCIVLVSGHGRLLEPAGRSSMWRFGYNTPVNYNDNQLFCGGYRNTVVNDGKCGVCGDPFQGPFENEAGGKYATGTIVRYYDITEEYINVTVDISAHHRGQFEFRLCPNNDVNTRVTQECLDQHVLQVEGGEDGGVHFVPAGSGIHHLRLGIPRGLTCSQCVLQWKYTTGISSIKEA